MQRGMVIALLAACLCSGCVSVGIEFPVAEVRNLE